MLVLDGGGTQFIPWLKRMTRAGPIRPPRPKP